MAKEFSESKSQESRVEINRSGSRIWFKISVSFITILLFSSCVKKIPLNIETDNLIKNGLHSHSQIKNIKGFINILIHSPGLSFTTSGNFYYKKPGMFRLNMFEGFTPERKDVILLPDRLLLPPKLCEIEILNYENIRYITSLIWDDLLFLPERYRIKEKRGCYIIKTKQFHIFIDKVLGEIIQINDRKNRTTVFLSNFNKTDDLILPHRIRIKYRRGEINMSLRQLQVNEGIPEEVFDVD